MTHDTRIALDAAAIGATLDDIGADRQPLLRDPGEAQARSYVLGRFGELGLADVRLEEFPYLGWQPAPGLLRGAAGRRRAPAGRPTTPTRCSTPRRGR